MQSDLDTLVALLDITACGPDRFVGRHPEQTTSRTFGGQLLAQGVIAAGRTLFKGAPPVHALHAHFIRSGDVTQPLEYHVHRSRDARTFANRQVTAVQGDLEIFTMLVAFQDTAAGLEHAVEIPDVPYPEDLPPLGDHFEGFEEHIAVFINALHPIDIRFANDPTWKARDSGERRQDNRVWMRADGRLPDDPLLHAAVTCYASDTTVLDSVITTHGLSWGIDRLFAATVNHSMWFHRPFRFDEWMLYATESPVASGSRGLAAGRFFTREGRLAVTVAQEALIRHFPPRVHQP
ncbi:acyl-CoA thioesterase II [Williamsia sp. CHRR-6]|uniref:acyl-CoA thioesterase n=1 Tax=Williamsia sp. CHRR-6 TaxID=2835871 RepID=UPI0020254D5E|nr:acyl-CoA thioesterase II [Williamsia sp. CHRR-6]